MEAGNSESTTLPVHVISMGFVNRGAITDSCSLISGTYGRLKVLERRCGNEERYFIILTNTGDMGL